MDACCKAATAELPRELAELPEAPGWSITTCGDCGKAWSFTRAGVVFYGQMRKCLRCEHWSCPCCGDFCDATIDLPDGPELCTCDGVCLYDRPPDELAARRLPPDLDA